MTGEVDPNVDAIPDRFKQRTRWLLWDASAESPRRPHWRGDFSISWNNPDDWHTFDEAVAAAQECDTWGIGYVVQPEDPEFIIDIDRPYDETGAPRDWFPGLERFAEADTYMEWSPSGNGIHIPVEGEVPEWWRDCEADPEGHQGVDVLTNKFCTFTGDTLDESGETVTDINAAPFLFTVYHAIRGETPRINVDESDTNGDSAEYDGDEWLTDDDVEAALDAIDPDLSHNEWIRLGYAVYDYDGGSTGKALFEQWSKRGDKWDAAAQRSIDSIWNGGATDTTVATLVREAKHAGWELPTKAQADGGTAAVQSGTPEVGDDVAPELSPAQVIARAGLGEDGDISDLNDREKAAKVWELIKQTDEYHVRVRHQDDHCSLWAYDDGTWAQDGERVVAQAARNALKPKNYGANVRNELKAQALADDDPDVQVGATELGLDPGLLAVANGVVDLDAAARGAGDDALRELEPTDYALTRLPVAYDPDATTGDWDEYVNEWAEDGKADALQEYVGYCLHVGALPIHRALLLVGAGANGKGTFLRVVRALLGEENTSSIELQTLANERDAVADFYGSLANIDDDLSARKLGQGRGMFKKLVGGDRVRARRLYQSGFEFQATGKHLYAANEVPNVDVSDDDEAFWRRWLLVEFPNHYPPTERDTELTDKLTDNDTLSGVLNWAIEGRRRLLEQGYFTNEYRYGHEKRSRWQAWGDSVDTFIQECLERDEDARNWSTSQVHQRYAAWCRETDHEPVGQQNLTNRLKREPFDYGRKRVDGAATRAFGALSFADEVPALDDTPDRDGPHSDSSLDKY